MPTSASSATPSRTTEPFVVVDDPFVDTVRFTRQHRHGRRHARGLCRDDLRRRRQDDQTGAAGWITFRARLFGIATLENLTPIAFGSNREVSIEIGEGAVLEATGIYLIAQAEDKSLADVLGAQQEWDNFLIEPARRARPGPAPRCR